MLTKEYIYTLIESTLAEKMLFLVDLKVDPALNITLELDSAKGITIAECVEVNRFLESQLDREKYDFSITVSSPGMSSAFKVREQYLKNINRNIEIKTISGMKFAGVLKELQENEVLIEMEIIEKIEKKKVKKIVQKIIPFSEIKETKKVISFKSIKQ